MDYVPPPVEMERTLAARFIFTMACSPPDQAVIKMFLYAQHVSERIQDMRRVCGTWEA